MNHAEVQAVFAGTVLNLEKAPGVASRDSRDTRFSDFIDFTIEKFARHFRLNEIINSRAATAPGALRKFDQL